MSYSALRRLGTRPSFMFSLYALIASVVLGGTFMLDKFLGEKEAVVN